MGTKQHNDSCEPGAECGFVATERNRYFTGKFMTARDFQGEQDYFLSRRRLHNRILHGWGIVCGLRVLPHPSPDCADRWVVVGPGIAIDCCGREMVLEKETAVEVWDPPSQSRTESLQAVTVEQEPQQDTGAEADSSLACEEPRTYLLCLRYTEKGVEQVPVIYAEDSCDPNRREANRVREGVDFETCTLDQVRQPHCWPVTGGHPHTHCHDDCDEELPGPAGICLHPECPCGERVPLALIRPRRTGEGYVIDKNAIDLHGRRHLRTPPEFFTHIVHINWPHGGEVSLSHLRNAMEGKLKVRFDRKLLPGPSAEEPQINGVSAYTFIVQYGGIQQQVEFLPFDLNSPPALEQNHEAVFTIDPDYTVTRGRVSLAGNVVYVTLKCDFILDCHGNPVDGNHLRGRLPSGNGTPGGIFESWFRVVPDGEVKETK